MCVAPTQTSPIGRSLMASDTDSVAIQRDVESVGRRHGQSKCDRWALETRAVFSAKYRSRNNFELHFGYRVSFRRS